MSAERQRYGRREEQYIGGGPGRITVTVGEIQNQELVNADPVIELNRRFIEAVTGTNDVHPNITATGTEPGDTITFTYTNATLTYNIVSAQGGDRRLERRR